MYGATKQNLTTTRQLTAGKHENVKLERIAKEPARSDGTGQTVLRFYFDIGGHKFNHTEFPVNEERVVENYYRYPKRGSMAPRSKEEAVEMAIENVNRRVNHILMGFLPVNEILSGLSQTESWDDYCDKVVQLAGNAFESETFRVKLVYNDKGYVCFPLYPFFIQNIKEEDNLIINPNKDRIIRPVIAITEPVNSSDVLEVTAEEVYEF